MNLSFVLLISLQLLASLIYGQNANVSKWIYPYQSLQPTLIPLSITVSVTGRVYITGYYTSPGYQVAFVTLDSFGAVAQGANSDNLPTNSNTTTTFNVASRQFSVGLINSSPSSRNITARSNSGNAAIVYDTSSVNVNRETFGAAAGDAVGNFVMMNVKNNTEVWITYYSLATPLWRSSDAGPAALSFNNSAVKIAHCSVMDPTNSSITYHAVTTGNVTRVHRFDLQNLVATMTFSSAVTPTAILVDKSRGNVFIVGVGTSATFEGYNNTNRNRFTFVTAATLTLVKGATSFLGTAGFDTFLGGAKVDVNNGNVIVFGTTFGSFPGFVRTNNASQSDLFLARVNPATNLMSVTQSITLKNDLAIDVAVDATNIYMLFSTFGGIYNITARNTSAVFAIALNLDIITPVITPVSTPIATVNSTSTTVLGMNATFTATATSNSSQTAIQSTTPVITLDPVVLDFISLLVSYLRIIAIVIAVVLLLITILIIYCCAACCGCVTCCGCARGGSSTNDEKSTRMMAPLATFNGNGTNFSNRDAPSQSQQTMVSPSGMAFRKYDDDDERAPENPNYNDTNRANTLADYDQERGEANHAKHARFQDDAGGNDVPPYEDFEEEGENFEAYPKNNGVDELDAIAATLNRAFE